MPTKPSSGYDPTKDISATLRLLVNILEKVQTASLQIDSQVNILIGLSSALFAFSVTRVGTPGTTLVILPLTIAAGGAAIVGLFAIHPPRAMRKKGQQESLLYGRTVTSFDSPGEYATALMQLAADRDGIVQQYAREIYNMLRFYYQPKRKLFHAARTILLLGISASLLAYLVALSL